MIGFISRISVGRTLRVEGFGVVPVVGIIGVGIGKHMLFNIINYKLIK